MTNEEKRSHPSFGLLQICRVSGNPGPLFGSSIDHQYTIRLRLHRAVTQRSLNSTWYYDTGGPLVEVEMSSTQWAEAISNMNTTGTPCTIRSVDGERMEDPPVTNEREKVRDEFRNRMSELSKKFSEDIGAIGELLQKKSLGKADRESIMWLLGRIQTELGSNVPFVHKMFDEAVDKTVAEAKGEVEAWLMHTVVTAGRQALAEKIEQESSLPPKINILSLEAPRDESAGS